MTQRTTRLTTTDAFFVAYQQQRDILMHFGVEIELASPPTRTAIDRATASTLARWPTLAQMLSRGLRGLRWTGSSQPIIHTGTREDIASFRNTPIDPFREPPFGVLWSGPTLAFRCHHAAADGELFIEIVRHFLAALVEKHQSDNIFSADKKTQSDNIFSADKKRVEKNKSDNIFSADKNRVEKNKSDNIFSADKNRVEKNKSDNIFSADKKNQSDNIFATHGGGGQTTIGLSREKSERAHPLSFSSLWSTARVGPSVRYARWLADEAKAERSLRLHLRKSAPGPVAICERVLGGAHRDRLFERARDEKVRPAWLIAAAWMQALHAWSLSTNDATTPLVSLEVPVTLRRGSDVPGNALAVTTLFGDARRPLGDLARGLWRDYARHIKQRDHLAVPLLSAPIRYLPWPLFKRVAVTTTSTGFATSHFTWLDHAPEGLSIAKRHLYTPVCQHMGAALCALASRDALQLSITHRTNGVSATDARTLADHVVDRLR